MAPPRPTQLAAARRRVFWYLVAGAAVLVVLLGLPSLAHLYTELLWFRSMGRSDVFRTVFWTRVLLGVSVGSFVALVLEINLRIALRLTAGLPRLHLRDAMGTPRIDVGSSAPRFLRPVLLLCGIVSGLVASHAWAPWLLFRHAMPFGVQDPLFGQDVGFYVFTMPVLEAARSLGFWVVILSLLIAGAAHLMRGGLVHDGSSLQANRGSRAHLTVLAALLFLLLGYDAWLDTRQLVYSTTGPVAGASYADVHARLPALRALVGASIVAALLALASITRRRLILLGAAGALYIGVSLLGAKAYPALIHRFTVLPNEATKEAPFIRRNIDATRAAYGLAQVDERDLSGSRELTRADVEANRSTIDNIRLWDHRPLLDTFAQIQEIRTYYEFNSVDNDRYMIDGRLRQTMLSPRELDVDTLPNRTWINERFTFTHGYGLTLGPVNQATEEGLPVLYVKDIPPKSSIEGLKVTRPAIYFGELSNDHVFVHTKTREFDHPSGDENVYAGYEGKAGVSLASAWTRMAVATRVGEIKLLLSDDIRPASKVLLHRDIRDRVRTLAPFLTYDGDPYMVVRDDGRLMWIQDAYTTTDRYPYAERADSGINYIRNAVKVTIDAYDGTVTFYAADPDDPILATWAEAFPGMFRPIEDMPADLRDHLRHPEDLFELQTQMFTIYHMDDPQLVYSREDQWEIPVVTRSQGTERMEPYYTVMRLPGEKKPEFILMLPFTPKRKNNLAAWMVARMDEQGQGSLRVYRFPRDRLVYGPQQVMNRINQEADISRQISLWDQRGSQAILGTLLVIPIGESLIYVCPLYLRSSGGQIPELKRVIVAYGDRIAMEPTLDAAVAAVFRPREGTATSERPSPGGQVGGTSSEETTSLTATPEAPQAPTAGGGGPGVPKGASRGGGQGPPSPGEAGTQFKAREAQDELERADDALKNGDWAGYGDHMARVRALIEQMAAETGPTAK